MQRSWPPISQNNFSPGRTICRGFSSAWVYLNGKETASHDGGYSTWRVDITDLLQRENLFAIAVDNAPNDRVYPQVADFTFYGGLYRDVNIICVSESHFDLDYFGGSGLQITPDVSGKVQIKTLYVGHSRVEYV